MRKLPPSRWITIIIVGILTMFASLTGNTGATALTWLSPPVALVLFVIISLCIIGVSLWLEGKKAASKADARKNRQAVLNCVRKIWIKGFLKNEIYYDKELLFLPLHRHGGNSWDLKLQDLLKSAELLPLNTNIFELFDEANGRLLILGDPGAGKTTLLLELTRDLLKWAENDKSYPIPVVLTLSSWATKRSMLEEWIVEELYSKRYQRIPRQIARDWIEDSRLILLLDGLDEVAPDVLSACIEAVNHYLAQANRSVVVCSRKQEYLDYLERHGRGNEGLHLRTAVSIQPLSPEQAQEYLLPRKGGSEPTTALEQEQDETLHKLGKLATTPLFLRVLKLTYRDRLAKGMLPIVEAASAKDQQHLLFHTYIDQVLEKDGPRLRTTRQQTRDWLGWLARQMTARYRSEFDLGSLQGDWLKIENAGRVYRWSSVLICGLGAALYLGLFFWLVGWLAVGLLLPTGLGRWPVVGLFLHSVGGRYGGLIGGLIGGLRGGLGGTEDGLEDIEPVEKFSWSWEAWRKGLPITLMGMVAFIGFSGDLGPVRGIEALLCVGLNLGLNQGLIRPAFAQTHLDKKRSINISGRNALSLGLIYSLAYGLLGGLVYGLPGGLIFGLLGALAYGLCFGGSAYIRHYVLRLLLAQSRTFPWKAGSFLDDAVEQSVLRKIGERYAFRHHLLQMYFASLPRDITCD